jgi:hypothetical protein
MAKVRNENTYFIQASRINWYTSQYHIENKQNLALLKRILFTPFIFLLCTTLLFAQQKFEIEKAELNFVSNAELELIKASSDQARGILDAANNQFAFSLEVKSFKGFNSELQREHFMEKYMEIHKYPKANFSGKIIEQLDFSKDGTFEVRAKGILDIHGLKQIRIIKCTLVVKNKTIKISTDFVVPLSDHNIAIPSIVSRKIATEIDITFKASMIPQE